MMTFTDATTQFGPQMRGIARRLDGKYTSFNDDDLYQEALLYLWESTRNDKITNNTESYILQGAYFLMKNLIRKRFTTMDSHSTSLQRIIDENNHTLESLLPDRTIHNRHKHIEQDFLMNDITHVLNDREKTVLESLMQGYTTREIGGQLGISHVMVLKIKNAISKKCGKFKEEVLSAQ